MDVKVADALYILEHQMLPRFFYDDEIDLAASVYNDTSMICKMFDDICGNEGLENPFTEEDFSFKVYQCDPDDDKWLGAVIRFPKPDKSPLCYEMYLFFDRDGGNKGLFTLEYDLAPIRRDGKLTETECAFLCAWDKQQNHTNFGSAPADEPVDFFTHAFRVHKKSLE